MSNIEQIAQIEANIQNSKKAVELGMALERLRKNKDFQKVVASGYLENEAVRLVHAKGNPDLQKPEKQAGIIKDIDGIASLIQYFNTINQLAIMAAKDSSNDEAELELLRNEAN